MIREAYDDFKRYLRDREMNSEKYEKITSEGQIEVESSDIEVGDLIIIEKNRRVPADVVLLRTTEKSGSCFIRTDQLDGETDWKLRIAVPFTQNLIDIMVYLIFNYLNKIFFFRNYWNLVVVVKFTLKNHKKILMFLLELITFVFIYINYT